MHFNFYFVFKEFLSGELDSYLTPRDFKRLNGFIKKDLDTSTIADLIPKLAILFFLDKVPNCKLKAVPSVKLKDKFLNLFDH